MTDLLSKKSTVAPSLCLGFFLVFALAAGLPGTPASAQGTPKQRTACEPDASRLCSEFMPDERTTASCLRRNLRKLSPSCRAVFAKHRSKGQR
jgi:hypothetical protein